MRLALEIIEKIGIEKIPEFVKFKGEDWDAFSIQPYINGREIGLIIINSMTSKAAAFSENRNSDSLVVYPGSYNLQGHPDNQDFNINTWTRDFNIAEKYPMSKAKYFDPDQYDEGAKFIKKYLDIPIPKKIVVEYVRRFEKDHQRGM